MTNKVQEMHIDIFMIVLVVILPEYLIISTD